MAKATTKAQPEPQLSLADQIRAAQQAAEELIEREAQKIKASRDGARLPIDWIRLDIRTRMKGGQCHCRCALNLLERDK
jgi:hypothetical protein